MCLKKTTMIVASMLLVVSAIAVSAKTPVAIIDPDPICDPLCIDPIDPVETPVNIYTTGTGKQILSQINPDQDWQSIGASIWVEGTHTPWGAQPERGSALWLKNGDVYSLSFPSYQLPAGSPQTSYYLAMTAQGGPILRRNGEFVRQYPSLSGNQLYLPWNMESYAQATVGKLWSGSNADIYALVRMESNFPVPNVVHSRIYRNDVLFKDFALDQFEPTDLHGGNLAGGQAAVVAGGHRLGKATVWKNNAYVTLSQYSSRVESVVRTSNGWLHATGVVYSPNPTRQTYAAYWRISPSNAVTEQRLSENFNGPPQALYFTEVVPSDIHVAANGKVYIVGTFWSVMPIDPLFQTGIVNPYSRNAVIWIDGQPQVLPAGDMDLDWDDARAVTTDLNGNYYVAGTWRESWRLSLNQTVQVGVVWKNGELYQIADASADASMFTDIVVPRL
jgi:hypothetical protein